MVLGSENVVNDLTKGKEVITSSSIASDDVEVKISNAFVGVHEEMNNKPTIGDNEKKKKKKLSVLIVDDQAFTRQVHRSMVNSLGMEVKLAENGKIAVDLHLSGASFDLILMDRDMPIMNGAEATRVLREMGVETMIVGVTAHEEGPGRQDFVEAGLSECLPKPISVPQIAALVKTIEDNMKAEKFPNNV